MGILTGFLGVIFWLLRITWMLSELSMKVETMWHFQFRRAEREMVDSGLARAVRTTERREED